MIAAVVIALLVYFSGIGAFFGYLTKVKGWGTISKDGPFVMAVLWPGTLPGYLAYAALLAIVAPETPKPKSAEIPQARVVSDR